MNSCISWHLFDHELEGLGWLVSRFIMIRSNNTTPQRLSSIKQYMTILNVVCFFQTHIDGNITWVDMSGSGCIVLCHIVMDTEGIIKTNFTHGVNVEMLKDAISNFPRQDGREGKFRFIQDVAVKCIFAIPFARHDLRRDLGQLVSPLGAVQSGWKFHAQNTVGLQLLDITYYGNSRVWWCWHGGGRRNAQWEERDK